ncbi:hypothetical protein CDL12_19161 [Handroanthus impetiginosus]|uniref:Uncharacterized protein n=1 Tax=Handroanthus impetiginosus TaxID=429701 RepID=A0A2G9GSP5_9LAMI|nr:hypothetical protein CDL12_19161 [Handroanthus impetiginosus]
MPTVFLKFCPHHQLFSVFNSPFGRTNQTKLFGERIKSTSFGERERKMAREIYHYLPISFKILDLETDFVLVGSSTVIIWWWILD